MSRLSRRLVRLVLLHHMESCTPSAAPAAAPRDAVADAVTAGISRIVAGFAEHAAHRIALSGFRGVPDTAEAITEGTPEVVSRPAVQPRPPRSQRAERSVRRARVSAIEAARTSMDAVAFAALNIAQQVQPHDRKR